MQVSPGQFLVCFGPNRMTSSACSLVVLSQQLFDHKGLIRVVSPLNSSKPF